MAPANSKGTGDIRRTLAETDRYLLSGIANAHQVAVHSGVRMRQLLCDKIRLVIAASQASHPVKRYGNKKLYVIKKACSLQRRLGQEAQMTVQFCPVGALECQYHFSQGPGIYAAASYAIKANRFVLTVCANALDQCILACVTAATRAIVAGCTKQKLVPALFAQKFVSLGNGISAAIAHGRPKKVVETLHNKSGSSL